MYVLNKMQKKKLALEQIKSIPVNGLLWIMLQLKMENGGVSSPLAAKKLTRNALALKQQALLSIAHQFSHGTISLCVFLFDMHRWQTDNSY